MALREKDPKDSPCASNRRTLTRGAAADTNRASVFLHDAARDPEAEAGAGLFFCGVERLEDLGEIFAGNSAAVVGHGDANSFALIGPVARRHHAYLQRAAIFHGIDRIDQKIR